MIKTKTMTSTIEWLIKQLEEYNHIETKLPIHAINDLLQQAKEMEKEQIIDAHIEGQRVFDKHPHTQWTNDQAEHYYDETYGNKGNNEYPEIEGTIAICNDIISPQTEISDEEIEKGAEENTCYMNDFILGAKWYREQLKKKI